MRLDVVKRLRAHRQASSGRSRLERLAPRPRPGSSRSPPKRQAQARGIPSRRSSSDPIYTPSPLRGVRPVPSGARRVPQCVIAAFPSPAAPPLARDGGHACAARSPAPSPSARRRAPGSCPARASGASAAAESVRSPVFKIDFNRARRGRMVASVLAQARKVGVAPAGARASLPFSLGFRACEHVFKACRTGLNEAAGRSFRPRRARRGCCPTRRPSGP